MSKSKCCGAEVFMYNEGLLAGYPFCSKCKLSCSVLHEVEKEPEGLMSDEMVDKLIRIQKENERKMREGVSSEGGQISSMQVEEVCGNCAYYEPIKTEKGFLADGQCTLKKDIKYGRNHACKKFTRSIPADKPEGEKAKVCPRDGDILVKDCHDLDCNFDSCPTVPAIRVNQICTTKAEVSLEVEIGAILERFMERMEDCLIYNGGLNEECRCKKEQAVAEIVELFKAGVK